MSQDQTTRQDPRQQYPQPEYGEQQQPHPGTDRPMHPQPDHGEQSYRGSGRLTGKKAVITGGDSGIGRAVALAFAREGADVLITYLLDEQHCEHVIERAVAEFGRIDVLVNNAAYQMSQEGIAEITTEQFDSVF